MNGLDVAFGAVAPTAFTNSKFRVSLGLDAGRVSSSSSKSPVASSFASVGTSGETSASKKGFHVVRGNMTFG
jgi:hypothetical protein